MAATIQGSAEMKAAREKMLKERENIERKLGGIRKIAVWSGKGGVGKTFFSIQLAYALKGIGKTALFDADIDCPNIPRVLGVLERMRVEDGKAVPPEKDGMPIISMGSMLDNPDDAIIWRGPMISNAIVSLVSMVEFHCKFLVIDLPPGTSDAALTIAQQIKPDGVIIVTTSDSAALADAGRSIRFSEKLKIPVLGVVENMAGDIFGEGGGKELAKKFGVPFLGSIPLSKKIRDYVDAGTPLCGTKEFGELVFKIAGEIIEDSSQ